MALHMCSMLTLFFSVVVFGNGFVVDGQSDLENRLASLESRFNEMAESCVYCPDSSHSVKSHPAFMAALSTDLNNCNNDSPVVFKNVKLNVGSPYDARHGTFRAPRNGTYFFAATLTAKPNNGFHVKFVVNSLTNEVGYLFSDTQHSGHFERSTSIVVHLNTGDDVWMACVTGGASNVIGGYSGMQHDYHSHFEGFLVD
ncbi:C1QT4-like protein [Mya arenaria]|uniref:C1QT4-like protein n=1 Tax=Mya arenaria TaxID=6604 RepID=A0ABY7EK32_MYAAR|nr:complement C1q tumor necrosis factor-related protein 3-like [Mya arenaria]WAR07556.1 C1QT4-like protein [Mya arenaria]